jgi:serine/threonine protein kinase
MVGQTVDHFRVTEEMQSSSRTATYRAIDDYLDRPVTLTFYPKMSFQDDGSLRQFLNQLRLAGVLNHPSISGVYSFFDYEEALVVVSGWNGGTSLRGRLSNSPVEQREALNIAEQVGLALQYAHSKGIVHRRINPDNIWLTPDFRVLILNFGVALPPDEAEDSREIAPYLSPEELSGSTISQATDIFSLGAVLYEMLTGWRPYPNKILKASQNSLGSSQPRWSSDSPVSAEIRNTISKALALDPNYRYQTVGEFLQDLSMASRRPTEHPMMTDPMILVQDKPRKATPVTKARPGDGKRGGTSSPPDLPAVSNKPEPFKVMVGYPKSFSKGLESKVVVALHFDQAQTLTREMLKKDLSEGASDSKGYESFRDKTPILLGEQVQVELFSQAIDFSQPVTMKLSSNVNIARFLAKPHEDCHVGNHLIKIVIKEQITGIERYSGFVQLKVVDYLFGHISRPFVSRCISSAITTGSAAAFALTFVGKIDHALGITAGTTGMLLGATLYGSVFKEFVLQHRIAPHQK